MSTPPQLAPAPQPGLPILYVNNFDTAVSPTEVSIILKQNFSAVSELKIALPLAKALHEALGKALDYYEKATGQKVETSNDLMRKLLATKPDGTPADGS